MSRNKVFTGIDIGTSKIATVIVVEDEELNKLRVVGVASVPSKGIRKSQVVDIEAAINAITQSVESAERMAGFSISDAYISVGGHHIQSQNSKGVVAVSNSGEEIIGDDVARVIEAAKAVSMPSSREILHVIPKDFIVDSQEGIKDPLSMTGIRLEVDAHIITGSTTAIHNLTKCVSEIGVNVNSVVFSGLAASHSVLTSTEKELGVCIVDIGGGTTSLSVFVEGSLSYSSVIPIGAKHITNDLAIGLRVSLEQAEKIKLALSTKSKQELLKDPDNNSDILDITKLDVTDEIKKPSYKLMTDGIIRPRLNEIFTMIGEELKKANLIAQTPAGVVLSGGGALTVGASDSCKRTLSMPVRISKLDGTEPLDQSLSGLVDDIRSPIFAVLQGLVLYATDQDYASSGSKSSLPQLGSIVDKFSGKGFIGKAADFIKSFLP